VRAVGHTRAPFLLPEFAALGKQKGRGRVFVTVLPTKQAKKKARAGGKTRVFRASRGKQGNTEPAARQEMREVRARGVMRCTPRLGARTPGGSVHSRLEHNDL